MIREVFASRPWWAECGEGQTRHLWWGANGQKIPAWPAQGINPCPSGVRICPYMIIHEGVEGGGEGGGEQNDGHATRCAETFALYGGTCGTHVGQDTPRQIVNRIQGNKEICTKTGLAANLSAIARASKSALPWVPYTLTLSGGKSIPAR